MNEFIIGVLDDNQDTITTIKKEFINDKDIEIVGTDDPAVLKRWAQEGRLDGIATDYNLERPKNGIDYLKEILLEISLPIVASLYSTSAFLSHDENVFCKQHGIPTYLRIIGYRAIIQNTIRDIKHKQTIHLKMQSQSKSKLSRSVESWKSGIVEKLKIELITSLKKIKNTDTTISTFEGSEYKIPEIVSQIEKETELGKDLIESWVLTKLKINDLTKSNRKNKSLF